MINFGFLLISLHFCRCVSAANKDFSKTWTTTFRGHGVQ